MYYSKIKHKDIIIEFSNDWLGVERIFVNGQKVSEQASIFGSTHRFTRMEEGDIANYALVVRMNMMGQVLIDLFRNDMVLVHGQVAAIGSRPKNPANQNKKLGILQLREYDVDLAIDYLSTAAEQSPDDAEIYFYLACAYSIKEMVPEGYEALRVAVEKGLADTEMILQHDKLAFLRLQDAFEGFFSSDFTVYDLTSADPD